MIVAGQNYPYIFAIFLVEFWHNVFDIPESKPMVNKYAYVVI